MDSSNETNLFNCTSCDNVTIDETYYYTLTSILLISSITALMVHVLFSFLLRRSQAFHSNVRLLLQNFSISACYVSLHSIGRACFNFYSASAGFAPGAVSVLRCELIETVFNASEGSLTLSMAFIGLDRLINTLRHKHLDSERPTALAYCMVVVSWAAGTAFHVLSILISSRQDETRLECYCQTMLVTPLSILYYMVAAFFVTEFSTALCYLILFRYSLSNFTNFTINTAQHSLAERHQMMSNMKTSLLLCPSIILHGSVYAAISLSLVPLRILISDDNYGSHICYALLILIAMELEMLTHPILLIVRKDTLRKAAFKYLPILGRLFKLKNRQIENVNGNENGQNKIVPINVINAATQKPKVQPSRNGVGKGKLVDFRIKPEDNDDILNALWASSGPNAKGSTSRTISHSKNPLPKINDLSRRNPAIAQKT